MYIFFVENLFFCVFIEFIVFLKSLKDYVYTGISIKGNPIEIKI